MDEFSFPTTATVEDSLFQLPFPHFNSSPSSVKATDWRFPTLNDADREERMDMLWEIFNEELVWISYDKMVVEKLEEETMPVSATMDAVDDSKSDVQTDDMTEAACNLQEIEMTRTGSMIRRRRQNLLEIVKMLKKFRLIQKYCSALKQKIRRKESCNLQEVDGIIVSAKYPIQHPLMQEIYLIEDPLLLSNYKGNIDIDRN